MNPRIFDHAIKDSAAYEGAIRDKLSPDKSGDLFFELALEGGLPGRAEHK